MSAPDNAAKALQAEEKTSVGLNCGVYLGRLRVKSHHLKINCLILDVVGLIQTFLSVMCILTYTPLHIRHLRESASRLSAASP